MVGYLTEGKGREGKGRRYRYGEGDFTIGKVGKSRIDSLSQREKSQPQKKKVFDRKSNNRKTPC